jgi:predicted nucleic acid-binding protein
MLKILQNYIFDVNVMIALVQPEAKLGPAVRDLWTTGQAQGSQFYVTPGVIASSIRLTSDARLWEKEPSTRECGDVIQNLLENSFFRIKQETARTTSIFLNLFIKYSPHSRDVNDFLIAANAMDLGAKLVTADQGFLRYPEVDVHALQQ